MSKATLSEQNTKAIRERGIQLLTEKMIGLRAKGIRCTADFDFVEIEPVDKHGSVVSVNGLMDGEPHTFYVPVKHRECPGFIYPEPTFYSIVFLHGDNANEALDILDREGDDALLQYLKQWDYGTESEHSPQSFPAGHSDRVYTSGEYTVSYNLRLGYVGLCRRAE